MSLIRELASSLYPLRLHTVFMSVTLFACIASMTLVWEISSHVDRAASNTLLAGSLGKQMAEVYRTLPDEPVEATDQNAYSPAISRLAWRYYPADQNPSRRTSEWKGATLDLSVIDQASIDRPLKLRAYLENIIPPDAFDRPFESVEAMFSSLSVLLAKSRTRSKLILALPDARWLEFRSDQHWNTRATHVHLGLIAIAACLLLLIFLSTVSKYIASQFAALAENGREILNHKKPEFVTSDVLFEAHDMAQTLNDLNHNLDAQFKNRTRFLVAISHDLRTPATRMKLRAELIEDDVLRGKMMADLDEISNMVNSSISFLRFGLEPEETQTIMFMSLLQSMCDDYADIGKDVVLIPPPPLVMKMPCTVFNASPGSIDIDTKQQLIMSCRPNSLKRALGNIIDNSLSYGGWAKVSTSATADSVSISVLDGGPGIPELELNSVFEPFYRVEGSRNRASGGTGLGLSVAKTIIESHGGTITLYNDDRQGLQVSLELLRMA